MTPEKNQYIKTSNHKYSTRILDVCNDGIKIKHSDHWDASEIWLSIDCIEWNESNDEWQVNKQPLYK